MPANQPPWIVCITGNIASGKTTFARLLAETYPGACWVPEPHTENPFLPRYLNDQARWGFTAQLHYFWDYTRVYRDITAQASYRYHFVDAGPWTNRLLYGEYLYRERIIDADEYAFYQTLCDIIQQANGVPEPHGLLFLDAAPQTCWTRMHRRGWSYQTSAIDLAYVETIQRYLDTMRQTAAAQGFPVLSISSEALDFIPEDSPGRQEALRRVQHFFQVHQITNP